MRQFDTGATRDSDDGKFDYEGFLNPLVIQEFGAYMHEHRLQKDGKLRASDNWQKGIPVDAYMKSLLRHVHSLWMHHRGYATEENWRDSAMGILFNIQGYTLERLKEELMTETLPVLDYGDDDELDEYRLTETNPMRAWPAFGINPRCECGLLDCPDDPRRRLDAERKTAKG